MPQDREIWMERRDLVLYADHYGFSRTAAFRLWNVLVDGLLVYLKERLGRDVLVVQPGEIPGEVAISRSSLKSLLRLKSIRPGCIPGYGMTLDALLRAWLKSRIAQSRRSM